jgi:hypothetical protein
MSRMLCSALAATATTRSTATYSVLQLQCCNSTWGQILRASFLRVHVYPVASQYPKAVACVEDKRTHVRHVGCTVPWHEARGQHMHA